MRKREIHSIAHWAMMFLLLMFPLLMVGISSFDNHDYDPQTAFVNTQFSDMQIGNEYYTFVSQPTWFDTNANSMNIYVSDVKNYGPINQNGVSYNIDEVDYITIWFPQNSNRYIIAFEFHKTGVSQYYYINSSSSFNFSFIYEGVMNANDDAKTLFSNYLYKQEIYDAHNTRNDVNLWVNAFINLPINAWYKSLMTVIGVGFTNSSVMNVIYVMPVYILWVFIFDVVVDCFLVIVKLPHKLLNRLSGGENE